jgi:hypothetical protein
MEAYRERNESLPPPAAERLPPPAAERPYDVDDTRLAIDRSARRERISNAGECGREGKDALGSE